MKNSKVLVKEVKITYKSDHQRDTKVTHNSAAENLASRIFNEQDEDISTICIFLNNSNMYKGVECRKKTRNFTSKTLIKKALITNSTAIIIAYKDHSCKIEKLIQNLKKETEMFNLRVLDHFRSY
jgi:hypothetical protein